MTDLFGDNNNGAEFSDCGKYRYKLWRIWNPEMPIVQCIGLNPSTANANKNDQTINILRRNLNRLGYGGLYMTNLFAFISSNPNDLPDCEDPIKDNDIKLLEVSKICNGITIVCWGGFKQSGMADRIKEVLPMFPGALCFGKNADGTPLHPMGIMWGGIKNPTLMPYNE